MTTGKSARALGNEAEALACKLLVELGYQVWRPSSPRRYKPYSGADILGVFDLVAVKRGLPTRWIQVKREAAFRRKVEAAIRAMPVCGSKEYWLLTGKNEWKIKVIEGE